MHKWFFLMANQALAAPGKLVYDPFVGTESILVADAHFGAITMGADIDIRVVRDGCGPDCNVWSNLKQYGLPVPVVLLKAVADASYGREAYIFYPILKENASSKPCYPEHPCFSLLVVSEQIRSFCYSRFLLTMVNT